MIDNTPVYSFSQTDFGFETCKSILGVSSNTMSKLIDLNLISILDDNANIRNQKYAGWSLEFLLSARNRPLLIPDGEIALICSIGREEHNSVPSLYLSGVWDQYYNYLHAVEKQVDNETWEKVKTHQYRITGEWRVLEEDSNSLVINRSIIVASYAGFILEGARIIQELDSQGFNEKGGRYYIVEPFNKKDKYKYAHNYLESMKGPVNKIWTSEDLKKELNT